MNSLVRQVLGESQERKNLDEVLPVVESTKPVKIHVCPHCSQEILEKHSYVKEGVNRHSDCGGAFTWPKLDPETVVPWLRPYLQQ